MKIQLLNCGNADVKLDNRPVFSKKRVMPCWSVLVEHPNGRFLFDCGPDNTIVTRLAANGLTPADIDIVFATNFDPEHIGGLKYLTASKEIRLAEEEYYWTCRTVFERRQPRENWEGIDFKTFYFKASVDGPVNYTLDLFGDESVRFVLCPGHTFGTFAVVLKGAHGKAVLASDVVLSGKTFEEGYIFHESKQKKSLEWLKAEARDAVLVLATHEPQETERTIEI